MYFLNFYFNISETETNSIEFEKGLNIVFSEKDNTMIRLIDILTETLYGQPTKKNSQEHKKNKILINMNNTEFNIKNTDETNQRTIEHTKIILEYKKIFNHNAFVNTSILDLSGQKKHTKITDCINSIKDILLNEQIIKNFLNIIENEKNLQKKIDHAYKKEQILTIKGLRKEKLEKEINSISKKIEELTKKKDSLLEYINTLYAIDGLVKKKEELHLQIKMQKKKISHIDDLKKQILSIKETIKLKFPHFLNKLSDENSLDKMQNLFNRIRDINNSIEFKRNIRIKTIIRTKIYMSALAGSAIIVTTFILYKSANNISEVLFPISVIGIGLSCIACLVLFQSLSTIKKIYPSQLNKEKTAIEKELFDYMKQNNFKMKDYKTEELYEYLLQYFEDFIKFNELKSEINELNKIITTETSLNDENNKLKLMTTTLKETETKINIEIKNLNRQIYSMPKLSQITETVYAIKEIISETEKEINQAKTISKNINDEIKKYNHEEDILYTQKTNEIKKTISSLKKKIETTSFINKTLKESAKTWLYNHINDLTNTANNFFESITNSEERKKYNKKFLEKIITEGIEEPEKEISKKILLSITTAMTYLMKDSPYLPPLIIIAPNDFDNNIIVNQLNKILLELSDIRQIIILTSRRMQFNHGKQITI